MPLTPEQKHNREPVRGNWMIRAKMKRGDVPVVHHAFEQYLQLLEGVEVEEFDEKVEDL